MEQVNLTTPETTPDNTYWQVNKLFLFWFDQAIRIELIGANGEVSEYSYDGAEATSLMIALNKTNLSTKSLHKRIMEKLVAEGKMKGAISGAPD